MHTRNSKIQHILNVAEAAFLEYGYNKTSIRFITNKARVNSAMINYYFKHKENLYNEVIERRVTTLQNFKFKYDENGALIEQYLELIIHYFELIQKHQFFFKLMLQELLLNKKPIVVNHINALFNSYENQIEGIIELGIDRGLFMRVNKEMVAKNILGFLVQIVLIEPTSLFKKHTEEELRKYFKKAFLNFFLIPN